MPKDELVGKKTSELKIGTQEKKKKREFMTFKRRDRKLRSDAVRLCRENIRRAKA